MLYHAANTLFKHPDHVKRCYALSGIYAMRDSMDGMYDDNFCYGEFDGRSDAFPSPRTRGNVHAARIACEDDFRIVPPTR